MQYTYAESFGYLKLARDMLKSLADYKARVAALHTGITYIQVDINKVYSYLEASATHNCGFHLWCDVLHIWSKITLHEISFK